MFQMSSAKHAGAHAVAGMCMAPSSTCSCRQSAFRSNTAAGRPLVISASAGLPRRCPTAQSIRGLRRLRSATAVMAEPIKAELILDNRGITSEGPAWDERKGVLYFVDIEHCYVYTYNPSDGSHTKFQLPEHCSTICLTEDPDTLVTTLINTVVEISAKDGSIKRTLAEVPKEHTWNELRFNEGKVAPGGVFILGRMHYEGPMGGPPGRLYKLDLRTEEGKKAGLQELLSDKETQVPNGMSWDLKKKVMYYNDTPYQTCTAYATDDEGVPIKENGKLKQVKQLKIEEGKPDGHTIDTDGNIWEALASTNLVCCYNPDTGELLHKIEVPVNGVTAATFGGSNLDELYITTLNHEGGQEKGMGGLYRAKAPPGVKGVAGAYFGKIAA